MKLPPELRSGPAGDEAYADQDSADASATASDEADSANPIVTAWRRRSGRRRINRWRIWLVPATIATGLVALQIAYGQFVSVPVTLRVQLVGTLWAVALPLAAGWLLFGLYDACLTALELLAKHRVRSGSVPTDEMLGLTTLSDFEILLAGLRLTLPPLIPRAIALGIAVWAALTATNWIWGLEAYVQYGGSYWLRGNLTETYFDSYYWDVIYRLLLGAPLAVARIAANALLACSFIVLAMICAGRLSLAAQMRGLVSAAFVLAQPLWAVLLLSLLYVPGLPEGFGLILALLPPAVVSVIIVAIWLSLVNGSPSGSSCGLWLGLLALAFASIGLFLLLAIYNDSQFSRYIPVLPANHLWAFSGLAVINPCSLPAEAYTWLLEDSYYNYGIELGQNSPYLLGPGPWLILVGVQLGMVAVSLAFAREAVSRWRQGAE